MLLSRQPAQIERSREGIHLTFLLLPVHCQSRASLRKWMLTLPAALRSLTKSFPPELFGDRATQHFDTDLAAGYSDKFEYTVSGK